MQKYYQFYEKSYEKFTPDWFDPENIKEIKQYLSSNSESLRLFIESYKEQFNLADHLFLDKKILVTGCGLGGITHYLAKQGANITGIDISKLAIMGAKEIASIQGLEIDYQVLDLCTGNLDEKFDFIIDDHLFHCLTLPEDRMAYLNFVKNHLTEEGIFFLETMAYQNKIQTPVGYSLDENNILWQSINGEEIMIRKIASSIDIESELKESGLSINYLYFHSELAFDVFTDYTDYPFQFLPRTIRLSAKK